MNKSKSVTFRNLTIHSPYKSAPKCSIQSNMECKSMVEFPLDYDVAILHGVFIKRGLYNIKLYSKLYSFRPKKSICFRIFDILNVFNTYFDLLQFGAKSAVRTLLLLVFCCTLDMNLPLWWDFSKNHNEYTLFWESCKK